MDMADLAAAIGRRMKEQNPEAYSEWDDAELGAQLLVQQQGQVHALFQSSNEKDPQGEAVVRPVFQGDNEKDAQGNAVVQPNQYGQAAAQTPPLAFLAPYLERGMDLFRGVTGLGDQGPAGPTWTNAGALLAAAAPFIPGKALKALATGERAAEGAESAAQGIRAYHGSPHDFERFDLGKVGTGEGAQAYGHGLYFAENEGVAKGYKQALSKGFEYQGQPVDPRSSLGRDLDFLSGNVRSGESMTEALPRRIKELRDHAEFMRKYESGYGSDAMYDRAADALAALDPAQLKPSGKTYEVNIKADPAQFLDWDKPISEQPAAVQELVAKRWAANDPTRPRTGAELYRELGPDAQFAADWLKERGVPGVKYLDQASRSTTGGELIDVFKGPEGWQSKIRLNRANGEQYFTTSAPHATREAAETWAQQKIADPGTRNYVVHDDKLIEILRKYGLLPPLAAGAAASQLHSDDSTK
jgi:hypothetical protein